MTMKEVREKKKGEGGVLKRRAGAFWVLDPWRIKGRQTLLAFH